MLEDNDQFWVHKREVHQFHIMSNLPITATCIQRSTFQGPIKGLCSQVCLLLFTSLIY